MVVELDFSTIIEQDNDFIPREWAVRELQAWKESDRRLLILSGASGIGKTALSADFVRESFFDAHFFCGTGAYSDPLNFVATIAEQLAEWNEAYEVYLSEQRAKVVAPTTVVNKVDIHIEKMGDNNTVIGVQDVFNNNMTGENADRVIDRFNSEIAEPLIELTSLLNANPVFILIDALEEAENHSGKKKISDLLVLALAQYFPAYVRFCVTTSDTNMIQKLEANVAPQLRQRLALDDPRYDAQRQKDIAEYVVQRAEESARFRIQLSGKNVHDFAQDVAHTSEGNFLYTVYLLEEIESGARSCDDLDQLPHGLNQMYLSLLNRFAAMLSENEQVNGVRVLKSLLANLSVLQEALLPEELAWLLESDQDPVHNELELIAQFLDRDGERVRLRPAVTHFIASKDAGLFECRPQGAHEAIARRIADIQDRIHSFYAYRLKYLPYHWAFSGSMHQRDAVDILLDGAFLGERVEARSAADQAEPVVTPYRLESDYQRILSQSLPESSSLEAIYHVIRRSTEIILNQPEQFVYYLRDELSDVQETALLARLSQYEGKMKHRLKRKWSSMRVDRRLQYILHGRRSRITCFATLPNSPLLVVGYEDGSLSLWDVEQGRFLRSFHDHVGQITCVVLSPDARFMFSGGDDHRLLRWQIDGDEHPEELMELGGRPTCIALGPDGRSAYIGTEWGTTFILDLTGETDLGELPSNEGEITACVVVPNASVLVVTNDIGNVTLWDLRTLTEIRAFQAHTERITSCTVSRDGKLLVTASTDRTLSVWSLPNGQLQTTLAGHIREVVNCAITSDNRYIVSGSTDDTARLWDVALGRTVQIFYGHMADLTASAYCPSLPLLLTGCSNGMVYGWVPGQDQFRELDTHTNQVDALYLVDKRHFITGAADGAVRQWDADTAKSTLLFVTESEEPIECAIFAEDTQSLILSRRYERRLFPVNLNQAKLPVRQFERPYYEGPSKNVTDVVLQKRSGRLIAASADSFLYEWQLGKPPLPIRRLEGHQEAVICCDLDHDEHWLVSGSNDGQVLVWDLASGQPVKSLRAHGDAVSCCTIQGVNDLLLVASGGRDGTIGLWHMGDQQPDWVVPAHQGSVKSCSLSKNIQLLATLGEDRYLKVWDVKTGRERLVWFLPIPGTKVVWLPETLDLVVCDQSGTVCLYAYIES